MTAASGKHGPAGNDAVIPRSVFRKNRTLRRPRPRVNIISKRRLPGNTVCSTRKVETPRSLFDRWSSAHLVVWAAQTWLIFPNRS